MDVILAIDGGGSRTRCLAIGRDGVVLSAVEGGASNHLQIAMDEVRASLDETLDNALKNAGDFEKSDALVSAGLAGVDVDGTGATEMRELLLSLGFEKAVINGDMIIAHAGALAGSPGVLALAGTGSCIIGIDESDRRVKVGGWGPIYGDEGSAYRIGQNALRAAARAFDGRGQATALTDAIVKKFGIADFAKTLETIYLGRCQPRDVAALSRLAVEVAEQGDDVARRIFIQAGEELAEAVSSAVVRLKLAAPKISYQGSVLANCDIVRRRFAECLLEKHLDADLVAPRFSPVVGSYLIGRTARGWETDEDLLKKLDEQDLKEA